MVSEDEEVELEQELGSVEIRKHGQKIQTKRKSNLSLRSVADKVIKKNRKKTSIDFARLKKEFNYKSLWADRTWKEIGSAFLVAFLAGFLPNLLDEGLDCWQAKDYLFGANYTKQRSTELVNMTNCVKLEFCTSVDIDGNEIITKYTYKCLETDPYFGAATIAFLFLPGAYSFVIFVKFFHSSHRTDEFTASSVLFYISAFLISVVAFFTFPIQYVLVYFIGLVNRGPEWTKLSTKMAYFEGIMDASLQFCLQLFVCLTIEDREPSMVQLASMTTSIAMLAVTRTDAWLVDEGGNSLSLGDRIVKTLHLQPLSLTNSLFKLGSIGVITALLRYLSVALYVGLALLWVVFTVACSMLSPRHYYLTQGVYVHAIGIGKIHLKRRR
jgi:hypothetical protein